jgi:SAM-dependent methyltransferase
MESINELSPRAGYAVWAACYDSDGNPLVALEGPAVREWFGPLEGRLVLDLGCGTGRHSLALAEAGAIVIALDQSEEMMSAAREKAGRENAEIRWILHAMPRPLPFADAVFDLVVLGLVAEHLVELESPLLEVTRVLKRGGRCILSALHPDRTAEGQRARFIDPETGVRQPIVTIHRTTLEYLDVAESAGLTLLGERTLIVPPEMTIDYPRSERYVGQALGWVACWRR